MGPRNKRLFQRAEMGRFLLVATMMGRCLLVAATVDFDVEKIGKEPQDPLSFSALK